ncbi:hypothetical protein BDZ89DRAFT_1109852 [Hymenopellis radicata]|nr:hypothetical protein BDZ89DRAFT_1109852 [Hymenopellis radicata]
MSGHGGAKLNAGRPSNATKMGNKKDKSISSMQQLVSTRIWLRAVVGKTRRRERERRRFLVFQLQGVCDYPLIYRGGFGSDLHDPGSCNPSSVSAPTTSTSPPLSVQQSAADDFDMEFGIEEYSEADWEEASTVRAASTQLQDTFTATSSTSENDNLSSLPTSVPVLSTTNSFSSLSNAQLEALQRKYRHVQEMDKSWNGRPSVIEDSLFDDDNDDDDSNDDGDGAEEALESESNRDQPNFGVLQTYLENELQQIQDEIREMTMPKNYLDGTFWRRAPNPIFVFHSTLRKSRTPDASPYYLIHIFVWIPYALPGAPDGFRCECGAHISKNGTRRKNDAGCGRNYQGTDAWIMVQLPRHLQHEFPAYAFFQDNSGRYFQQNNLSDSHCSQSLVANMFTYLREGHMLPRHAFQQLKGLSHSRKDDESHQSSTDESDRVLKLNKSRVVLRVEKILVPGFIVPLHSATLAELEQQHSLPFDIMVHRRSVHTRAPIPAQTFNQAEPSSPDTSTPFTPADLSNAEIDLIAASGFGRQDAEDELSKDEVEDEAEEIDHDSRERSCTAESSSDEQPTKQDTPTTLLTCLFDDIFHVEDHLLRLLPKKHSAFEKIWSARTTSKKKKKREDNAGGHVLHPSSRTDEEGIPQPRRVSPRFGE